MINKNTRPIAILSIVLIFMSACNLPGTTTLPPAVTAVGADVIYTAAAQTLAVQLTEHAPTPGMATDTPDAGVQVVEETNTPLIPPTDTPSPYTSTPEFTNTPMFTATSSNPMITASMPTNCRTGTSKDYPRVGSLNVGDVSQVIGRNSTSTWWYIENPSNPGSYCWVWGETTSVTGNTSALQVMTPPPPPPTSTSETASSFSTSFADTHKCSGDKYAYFKVTNSGGKALESANVKIKDETDGDTISSASSNKPFLSGTSDCSGDDTLEVGDSAYVAGYLGGGNSGHEAKAAIYLCTKESLEGSCTNIVITFTIP
ncbi:MAG: hypothetical protein JW908_08270 [Anaerolineales bacterium]|nr:hypothetical protein [Anaerolineales bacterium]